MNLEVEHGQNMSKPKQTTTVSFRDIRKIPQGFMDSTHPKMWVEMGQAFPYQLQPSAMAMAAYFWPSWVIPSPELPGAWAAAEAFYLPGLAPMAGAPGGPKSPARMVTGHHRSW